MSLNNMDILSELFSSSALIKILRLFYLNPEEVFELKEISKKAKVSLKSARVEINLLKKIGFIKPGSKQIEIAYKTKKPRKKKVKGWVLNEPFPFLLPLKNLVLNAAPLSRDKILRKLKGLGRVKLIVLSGIFVQEEASRVDVLIVGDSLKKGKIENAIKSLEAEVGKELAWANMDSEEFLYRMAMYDKFVRDILDYPHEILINKLDI